MPSSDPIYTLKNVPLFETLYGKNLISLGGFDALDKMFSDLNLSELKLLDIGFGLGGAAFYLAKKFNIEISGVEIYDWMIQYAKDHAPKKISHLLNFQSYGKWGELLFKPASFDLVYSKGVLNHVKDKEKLFLEVHKVLKSEGLLVIYDWIYPEISQDDSHPLVKETKKSYAQILEKTGFKAVRFRDDSLIFLNYVKDLLSRITQHQKLIKEKYGEEIFSEVKEMHLKLVEDINHQRKFSVRIVAERANLASAHQRGNCFLFI